MVLKKRRQVTDPVKPQRTLDGVNTKYSYRVTIRESLCRKPYTVWLVIFMGFKFSWILWSCFNHKKSLNFSYIAN